MKTSVSCGMKCALLALACVFAGSVFAQDMVKVAPKNTKVLIDNDQVRVIEVWLKPGESLPMHSHPANVVYFETGGKAKSTSADGKVTEMDRKAGEAIYSEPITHSNQNTGTTPTKALVVELKTAK